MKLSDRIRRWWNPAQWADDHPEYSAGEGFALGREKARTQVVGRPSFFKGPGSAGLSDTWKGGRYRRR